MMYYVFHLETRDIEIKFVTEAEAQKTVRDYSEVQGPIYGITMAEDIGDTSLYVVDNDNNLVWSEVKAAQRAAENEAV